MKDMPKIAPTSPPLPSSPLRFAWYFISHFKWPLLLMFLVEAGQKICQTYIPFAFKEILDHATQTPNSINLMAHLKPDIYFFIAINIGALLFARTSGAILVFIGPSLRNLSKRKIFKYIQHHSQSFFNNQFTGSIANRINEISLAINHGLWTITFDFWPILVNFITSIYLLFTAHKFLALFLFTWTLIFCSLSFRLAQRCRYYAKKFTAERSRTTGQIVDAITNMLNMKLFSNFKYEQKRLENQFDREIQKARKLLWFIEKIRWFQMISGILLQLGLITGSLYLYSKNQLSIGNFAMAASLGLVVINESQALTRRFLEFFEYIGNLNDGLQKLIQPHQIIDRPNAQPLCASQGDIEFKNVYFSYPSSPPLFKNLNVHIKPKEKIGLVGYSGSGKTTFVNLILRLYEIQNGSIQIDGQDIQKCSQTSLRKQISFIPQEPVLFHRSILENIRYGKLTASDEEVYEAAKKACAHEFIMTLDKQYQTLVGERGIKLSGGQRQRIALARAFLKNAPILILDESTSSLDSLTEYEIQKSIQTLAHNKTTIIIAHRLSTIVHMDRLLIFKNGQIVESGSHRDLIKKETYYKKLWGQQTNGLLSPQTQRSPVQVARP
ncbi:MAG: ABC transporter ATP-binding protein [Bdellovibrio sp.]|nr:MAG: ABC transporter ATP-binding protein [Bdellovibrio sp.]